MTKLKDEPFRIKYISKKNCFLHLPGRLLRTLINSSEMCLKIQYGNSNVAYVSWYNQPYNSDGSQYVGLNATYAKILGIKDEEDVFISSFTNAHSVSKINVSLLTFEEWDIMESNIHAVQSSLLDQVRVVWNGQTLPVWVSKYLHFTVRVDVVEPNCHVGILEPYTDLGVLLPNEEAKAEPVSSENTHSLHSSSTNNNRMGSSAMKQIDSSTGDHQIPFDHCEANSSSTYNIWDTVKGMLSHDVPVSTAPQERGRGCYAVNSELNDIVCHALFRAHPLPRLIVKTEPITRNDVLLYHPFNVFIHRSNLPRAFQTVKYVICKVTKLTIGKADEKHAKHSEDTNNELPDLIQLPKQNSLTATYAHICIIEDVYDKLTPELKENFKEAVSYSQHQSALISDSIFRRLNLAIGSRIDLSFQHCKESHISSLKLIPRGRWDLDKYSIEKIFRDSLLRLSAGAPVVLNSTSLLNLKINSVPIGDVLVQTVPEDIEFAVLDEVTVARCKIDAAEVCSLDVNDVPMDDKYAGGSDVFYFGSSLQHLIEEGVCSLKMSLLLEPSLSFWASQHIRTELISNILILGRLGSGKTTLAKHLCRTVAEAPSYVHCVTVQCRQLKGKKVETLQKMVMQSVTECIFHQPSVLVLDDIDAIAGTAATEEHTAEDSYFFRIGDMLTNILHGVQSQHYVVVIATAPSVTKLNRSITAARGQHFFNILLDIPELSKNDRLETLKSVILEKTGLFGEALEALELENHAAKAEGYVVQDIVDLVDKAVFQGWRRMCSPHYGHREMVLKACDINVAMDNNVPLSLRGVTLHKDSTQTWADVGGLTDVKQQLIEVLQWPSQYIDLFAKCPLRHQSGLLLYGAPGTGKTLLAAAVSHECGLNFISVKGPELLSKYIGASEEAVRNIFQKAQSARPCVLFFDEFDSLAPRRGHDSTGVTDRVVNQLLTQLDGVESLTGVWVVAATSRPDLLDPALLRPGRLDKTVLCPLPNVADRIDILRALSRKLNLAADTNLKEIAEKSEGFTGADLQAVLYTAQLMAVENQQKEVSAVGEGGTLAVSQELLLAALADTRPSLSPQEKQRYQRIYDAFVGSRKGKARSLTEVSQRATLA